MTQEQKLEIVYKKLFNERVFTKEGTQFFEEPLSTFSQVPLSYVYINSDYIPSVAPKTTISVAGSDTLKYVDKERALSVNSSGARFISRNKRIIPTSYGTGYGIEIRTKNGELIDPEIFPYLIDWESGEITFDDVPFDVDFHNPPLLSYHYYCGKTLESVNAFTIQGPSGNIGPTGVTGPMDYSILTYRGKTNFTASPAVTYVPNDVITFTTDGNSYVCLSETTSSPSSSPASWENISPSGGTGQIPEHVLYVNHPNAVPTSSLRNGSPFHFVSLQEAVDASPDGVATTIIVNQLNNQYPTVDSNLIIRDKVLNIIFRKWANLSSERMVFDGFNLEVIDSDVTIENAQIGGNFLFKEYPTQNQTLISSDASECSVKFVDCKVHSKLLSVSRTADNNCLVTFERCSINPERIVCNADVSVFDSTFSGSITADYSQEFVQGLSHRFEIVNSFGFQRTTRGSIRSLQAYDVVIIANRNDLANLNIKFENSFLPCVGVVFTPEVFLNSPEELRIDSNNCTFFNMGLDESSAIQGGTINVVGSNVLYAVNQNYFASRFFTAEYPYETAESIFLFLIDDPAGQRRVVNWQLTTLQTQNAYNPYKSLVINETERTMLSI